jgi:hypothetical protein
MNEIQFYNKGKFRIFQPIFLKITKNLLTNNCWMAAENLRKQLYFSHQDKLFKNNRIKRNELQRGDDYE